MGITTLSTRHAPDTHTHIQAETPTIKQRTNTTIVKFSTSWFSHSTALTVAGTHLMLSRRALTLERTFGPSLSSRPSSPCEEVEDARGSGPRRERAERAGAAERCCEVVESEMSLTTQGCARFEA